MSLHETSKLYKFKRKFERVALVSFEDFLKKKKKKSRARESFPPDEISSGRLYFEAALQFHPPFTETYFL